MIKKALFLISLLFLSGCHRSDSELAHAQFSRYAKKAYQDKGLILEGCGGSMMKDIKDLVLSFASPDHLTLIQTRQLVVQILDEFLHQINNDEDIRPRLHTYPFTPNNISLKIGFRNEKNERPPREYIAYVSISNGLIHYSHWDREKRFCDHYKESISDAMKIVMEP